MRRLTVSILLLLASIAASATPVVEAGYTIETYATGLGAVAGLTIGPDGGVYAADNAGGRILRAASDGSVTVVASGIPFANGITFDGSGRLFAASGGGQAVYSVTGGTASVFAGTALSFPTSVAASGSALCASNSGNGTISRIDSDGTVHEILAGFSAPNGPFGISFDQFGIMHFIDHATGGVYAFDLIDSPQLLYTVSPLGGTFTGSGFNGQLFVTDVNLGELLMLDGAGGASVFATGFTAKVAPPAIGPNGIAFDGSALFIGDGDTIYKVTSVPEPATLSLLGLGLAGVGFMRRRRTRCAPPSIPNL